MIACSVPSGSFGAALSQKVPRQHRTGSSHSRPLCVKPDANVFLSIVPIRKEVARPGASGAAPSWSIAEQLDVDVARQTVIPTSFTDKVARNRQKSGRVLLAAFLCHQKSPFHECPVLTANLLTFAFRSLLTLFRCSRRAISAGDTSSDIGDAIGEAMMSVLRNKEGIVSRR